MKKIRLLFLLFALPGSAQNWSSFLDTSRAIDWSEAGFTIPNYTVNCSTQPSLATGSGNASANATAIQNALNSCDSTHNVVNIPAGTYYVAGFNYGTQGKQVLRGAGPNSTRLYITTAVGCGGFGGGICMLSNPTLYGASSEVIPPSGSNQCMWTAGFSKGTTSITLSSCGGTPPVNKTIILDQKNDTSDTGGVYICDDLTDGCTLEAGPGDNNGRVIGGVTYSQQQVAYVTGVTSLGGGSYTVTISPGVMFNNVRIGQTPGAWWPGFVQNDGLENITVDYSNSSSGTTDFNAVFMFNCYQCWMKNVRSIDAARTHAEIFQSGNDVIRDSYFYQARDHAAESYTIELDQTSGTLIENNIFQQSTIPIAGMTTSGSVIDYNFTIDNLYTGSTGYINAPYYNHNAGSNVNLWEGNNTTGIWADAIHGSSVNGTLYRNSMNGWSQGNTNETVPLIMRSYIRGMNMIGNVMGQPSYHNQYQTYATSNSGGIGGGAEYTSIYSLGWASGAPFCGTGGSASPYCDAKVFTTLMRWGNYDTVTNGVKWDSTEASPGAATYLNANFSSSYFGSLAHTLPASLLYNSTPSWWPSGKAWPPIGPDVSTGNVGICTGTYAGAQATQASQCTGGTLTTAWASHISSIPAQDCFLTTMGGNPAGTGSSLSFDASACYSSTPTVPTAHLTGAQVISGTGGFK